MNAYQRVMNTLQGLPTDRVPVFAVLCAYGGKLTQTDLRTLYSDVNAYVASQRALQDTFGLDLVMAPLDYSAIAEAFGSQIAFFANDPPRMKQPAAKTVAEALALPLPDPHRTKRLPFILESARQLYEIYREQVPLFAAVPSPSAICSQMMGLDLWLETLLFDDLNAQKLLDFTTPFFVAWSNALLETGVSVLLFTEVLATAEIAPRHLFAQRIYPHLQQIFPLIQGPILFHNSGGQINHNLDLIATLPSVVGVGIGSKDNLSQARERIGPDLLLLGNLDNLGFPTVTAAEIQQQSLSCLKMAAPSGHYILCNSSADIPLNTPPENIHAMLAASHAYAANLTGGNT